MLCDTGIFESAWRDTDLVKDCNRRGNVCTFDVAFFQRLMKLSRFIAKRFCDGRDFSGNLRCCIKKLLNIYNLEGPFV